MGIKENFEIATQKELILWEPNVPFSQIADVSYYTGTPVSIPGRNYDSYRFEYNVKDRADLGAEDSIAAFIGGRFIQSLGGCSQVLDDIELQTTTGTSVEVTALTGCLADLAAYTTTSTTT